MKKLLNTLFVTVQGTVLHRDNDTIHVREKGESLLRVPVHLLSGIVCFGGVSVTPECMGLCAERGVLISFLSMYGRFIARVTGPVTGNVLLRKAQYTASEEMGITSIIARRMLTAKVANCRTSLQRFGRDYPVSSDAESVKQVVRQLASVISHLQKPSPLESIRGMEGDAARNYFRVFDHLIVTQKEHFSFRQRNRRPPLDPVNALLSFLYTLLVHDVTSACESTGLDPAVGFLHRDRPGRPSLALDLMEELRPILADRLALSLINRKQLKCDDFKTVETGAVVMTDEARKTVLNAWQEKKRETLIHPFLGEKVEMGMIPFVQALLLARYLRRDIDDYPAFLWR